MSSNSNTSLSDSVPLNDLLSLIILALFSMAFFVSILAPSRLPPTLPLALAVIRPSIVRCLKSSTSFCDCSNANWIC